MLQHRWTTTAAAALLVVTAGCGARVPDVPAASVASAPAIRQPPDPTAIPVATRDAGPEVTFVAAGQAPTVTCGGGTISGADIDFVGGSKGVADIVAATLSLDGVLPTDVVVAEQTVTVIVRDGKPVWRGHWADGGNGLLLNQIEQCRDARIGPGAR